MQTDPSPQALASVARGLVLCGVFGLLSATAPASHALEPNAPPAATHDAPGRITAPSSPASITATPMAEPPPAVRPNAPVMSVEEIRQRNALARGGLEEWRKIDTMLQVGRIERGDEVPAMSSRQKRAARLIPEASQIVQFRLELAKPNKLRLEFTYQGVTAIQAFDGTEGYTVQPGPQGAIARPFSDAQARAAADQLDIQGPLLDADAKGTHVAIDGIDAVRGRPAYRLKLTLKSGLSRQVWVDAETFYDVKIDGMRRIGDRNWPVETYFGDFRKVGKVWVPYESETAINGVHTMEHSHLAQVRFNVPLADSLFKLPKAPVPPPLPSPAAPPAK